MNGKAMPEPKDANRLAFRNPSQGTEEVSLLRRLRVVASAQLSLAIGEALVTGSFWDLPEAARAEALTLLAAMIAKGVLSEQEEADV
jgi:hypothetical protein